MQRKNFSRVALVPISFAILGWAFAGCGGCNSNPPPPAFTGGIYITATVNNSGHSNPQQGVFIQGNMTSGPGPQSRGSLTQFSGTTDRSGTLNEPQAMTDAYWALLINFSLAIPACNPPSKRTIFTFHPAGRGSM